jgi:hypothetical protein
MPLAAAAAAMKPKRPLPLAIVRLKDETVLFLRNCH